MKGKLLAIVVILEEKPEPFVERPDFLQSSASAENTAPVQMNPCRIPELHAFSAFPYVRTHGIHLGMFPYRLVELDQPVLAAYDVIVHEAEPRIAVVRRRRFEYMHVSLNADVKRVVIIEPCHAGRIRVFKRFCLRIFDSGTGLDRRNPKFRQPSPRRRPVRRAYRIYAVLRHFPMRVCFRISENYEKYHFSLRYAESVVICRTVRKHLVFGIVESAAFVSIVQVVRVSGRKYIVRL